MDINTVRYVIEIIGTVAFAVSGAMIAIDHDLDIFGVLFMGIIVALGGGTLRDTLLGALPPRMFTSYVFLAVAGGVALLVFVLAWISNKFYPHKQRMLDRVNTVFDRINSIFDAVGLASFTISGMQVAIHMGYGDNGFLVVVMGTITAVGGGVIRDICVHDVPMVFSKNIYAVASILGGILYYALYRAGVNEIANTFGSMAFILTIRILAIIFKLNLPHARRRTELTNEPEA